MAVHLDFGTAIGIDLGTSYCKVAAFREGKVEIIQNGGGSKKIPSYVAFPRWGETLIGHEAKNQVYLDYRKSYRWRIYAFLFEI